MVFRDNIYGNDILGVAFSSFGEGVPCVCIFSEPLLWSGSTDQLLPDPKWAAIVQ